ncbi:DNA mismatch repair protein MutL [Spizellomyces punctatus DAOM BR117]|uniref:DNA mismatch repair protein MutL n=1 Tax=Spizellomyces punctatus (strain DAOM BR117) TaxID=645134 RepID=A0A0L0HQX6_SPIPD|nr:DNA mismatch repair protein MutL [Spizellomyces punctatus DAOM BR117]KND03473.1 DNA mismatch repair protein MutL [Spizellomyces punctatus DAOM BR117]|eukprot:XP_016611512.1 DNA mismatch repair protein MutL [Spizellomyces punctatus DAOM BR117]
MARNDDRAVYPVAHIKRLDENVVNRIAAGEIIHRPSNALKEMIENSLDAQATSIQITVKDGGLKLLQIQDNGVGIHKEDLPMVCERFATSKLECYEDLSNIATYGFRGEALASISHVAHVTVTTKTNDSPCAWRAFYSDGKLVPGKPGTSADPKPCAGNQGTQIVVEDLFYNVPTRRKALKSSSDEYNRILDIVHKYAIHNSRVSFTCKKQGANTADIHTPSSAKTLDNIRYVFGATIAKELLEMEHTDSRWDFKLEGLVSNANFSTKKMIFLLFINHRSVDSSNLKRAVEAVYTEYLPRGTHPFVYLSLEIKPENVDVNVHPTKREVHFLNEDKIIQTVCEVLQSRLADANQSRTFYTQTFLPGAPPVSTPGPGSNKSTKAPEHKLVRTDSRTRTLDAFITHLPAPTAIPPNEIYQPEDAEEATRVEESSRKRLKIVDHLNQDTQVSTITTVEERTTTSVDEEEGDVNDVRPDRMSESNLAPHKITHKGRTVEVRLTSVLELRDEVRQSCHKGLTDVFAEHTFVGLVDDVLAIIQHQTKLYLVDYQNLSQELFYQLALQGFSNFGFIQLSQPASIFDLVMIALEAEDTSAWPNDMMSKEEIAEECRKILVERRDMLLEYFSFHVSEAGEILSLPVLLRGYVPNVDKLPLFLLRIGSEVDWDAEKPCFEGFSRELGLLYALEPSIPLEPSSGWNDGDEQGHHHTVPMVIGLADRSKSSQGDSSKQANEAMAAYRWVVQHVVFPALKEHFVAPQAMAGDGTIVQLANLPDLYRVFERC